MVKYIKISILPWILKSSFSIFFKLKLFFKNLQTNYAHRKSNILKRKYLQGVPISIISSDPCPSIKNDNAGFTVHCPLQSLCDHP